MKHMETTETKTSKVVTNSEIADGKSIAIIAYLTIIGLLIAFIMNGDKKNEFAKYHICQSLGLALTSLALGVIGMIPILGWLVSVIGFFVIVFMWISGLMNAVNEKQKPIQILGNKYEEWFQNL